MIEASDTLDLLGEYDITSDCRAYLDLSEDECEYRVTSGREKYTKRFITREGENSFLWGTYGMHVYNVKKLCTSSKLVSVKCVCLLLKIWRTLPC